MEYYRKLLTGDFAKLYSVTMPICDTTKSSYYPKMIENSNFPPPNTCPMPEVRAPNAIIYLLDSFDISIVYCREITQFIVWWLTKHFFRKFCQEVKITSSLRFMWMENLLMDVNCQRISNLQPNRNIYKSETYCTYSERFFFSYQNID